MQRVVRRVYGTNDAGRRILLARPGDVLTDEQVQAIMRRAEREPDRRLDLVGGCFVSREAFEPEPVPRLSLSLMTLAELQELCADEGIDPGGANLRGEYIAAIEAAQAAGSHK